MKRYWDAFVPRWIDGLPIVLTNVEAPDLESAIVEVNVWLAQQPGKKPELVFPCEPFVYPAICPPDAIPDLPAAFPDEVSVPALPVVAVASCSELSGFAR